MKNVLRAINFEFPIEKCLKILENVKITMVSRVYFIAMAGIDGIYLNSNILTRNDKRDQQICKIVGFCLHEFMNYLIRKLKNNYLLPTPKQQYTFFEIGTNF